MSPYNLKGELVNRCNSHQNKMIYKNPATMLSVILKTEQEQGVKLTWFKCEVHNGYHLTKWKNKKDWQWTSDLRRAGRSFDGSLTWENLLHLALPRIKSDTPEKTNTSGKGQTGTNSGAVFCSDIERVVQSSQCIKYPYFLGVFAFQPIWLFMKGVRLSQFSPEKVLKMS